MIIFKQNVRIMSCYFLTFKFLLKTYFKLIGLFRFWNLALCNHLVALEAVRSILKLISNPDLSRPGQGTDLNFQNKIDFLKVLNFSFPVPIVGPCMKDVYHLQRAKIYRRNFPPVGFIQSRTVLLMRRQSNPITPHETWIELCAVYFVRAVLRLYSNTKPSANDSANAFYQGRDHVWVKESELQRCYQQQVIECGKEVLFVFVFVLWQLATTHATGRK